MAAKTKTKAKPKPPPTPRMDVATLSKELQDLQRERVQYIKSKNMVANRLRAIVATLSGYRTEWTDEERKKAFKEAQDLIDRIRKGEEPGHPLGKVVVAHTEAIALFEEPLAELEKSMVRLAEILPVAKWVLSPDQKGFGLLGLAIVVGECGNLSDYANPAKVWKRLGCAPFTSGGKTLMGSTWRRGKEGSLNSEEWTAFGYSPRRRSIAYLIGDGLMKQNGPGPYRKRYDEAKAAYAARFAGQDKKRYPPNRAHLHGMLLCTKRLLRELWVEWNK